MEFAANASNLHKKIGSILASTSPFRECKLEQEVKVKTLFPEYGNGKDGYDWVIPELHTIIEAHGKQHYKVATFGSSAENAVMNFQSQKFRDSQKEEIALLNGWKYIIIPYTEEKKLDGESLIKLFNEATCGENPTEQIVKAKPDWVLEKKEQAKLQAKQARREQYLRSKELLKRRKNESKRLSEESYPPDHE
jgi:hypothetical protein